MEIKDTISQGLYDASLSLKQFIQDEKTIPTIEAAARLMFATIEQGGKIITCGNGGSLCDATHFAEEMTGRFRSSRLPLPAIAVNDSAYLTCTANDFSFDDVFSRYVEGVGCRGDVLLCISTSGKSENIIRAARTAKAKGLKCIALTSKSGTLLSQLCDIAIQAPDSPYSDRIQEIHIKVIHLLIQCIEELI